MLNNFSRARLLGWWFGAVALAFVVSAVAGAPITLGAGGLWVVASLVPAAVMLLLWRDAPTVTVAEVLYTASHSGKEGRS